MTPSEADLADALTDAARAAVADLRRDNPGDTFSFFTLTTRAKPSDRHCRPGLAWAEGRPFAWIDDQITDVDRDWVRTHHDGPALLHYVDPAIGLVAEDFEALAAWAETV